MPKGVIKCSGKFIQFLGVVGFWQWTCKGKLQRLHTEDRTGWIRLEICGGKTDEKRSEKTSAKEYKLKRDQHVI